MATGEVNISIVEVETTMRVMNPFVYSLFLWKSVAVYCEKQKLQSPSELVCLSSCEPNVVDGFLALVPLLDIPWPEMRSKSLELRTGPSHPFVIDAELRM